MKTIEGKNFTGRMSPNKAIEGVKYINCIFEDMSFSGILNHFIFENCTFKNVLASARIKDGSFRYCVLENVKGDMYGSWENIEFSNSDTSLNFSDGYFVGVNVEGGKFFAEFKDMHSTNLNLEQCLAHLHFENSTFSKIDVRQSVASFYGKGGSLEKLYADNSTMSLWAKDMEISNLEMDFSKLKMDLGNSRISNVEGEMIQVTGSTEESTLSNWDLGFSFVDIYLDHSSLEDISFKSCNIHSSFYNSKLYKVSATGRFEPIIVDNSYLMFCNLPEGILNSPHENVLYAETRIGDKNLTLSLKGSIEENKQVLKEAAI